MLRGAKLLCVLVSTDRVSRAQFLFTECAQLSGRTHLPGCRSCHMQISPLTSYLAPIAGQHPDLRDTWADGGWQLCAIDATRGHSRDRSLMHPCYILIQVDDYWVFNHRPHGLLELVLGSLDLSFPCVLPQMINFPVLQAFLSPLLPQGLSCLSLQMWHNGAAVDYQLVSCFNGFFIQITVEVNSILMENIKRKRSFFIFRPLKRLAYTGCIPPGQEHLS